MSLFSCSGKRSSWNSWDLDGLDSVKFPMIEGESRVFHREDVTSEDARPANELPDHDKKIQTIVLGSQLLNACQKRDRQEADRVLSQIRCFDSLKMKGGGKKDAATVAINNGMYDIARKINEKEFSCLIDACRANDLQQFETIYTKMEKSIFRQKKCTAHEMTLILNTYSDIVRSNWENGRMTTFNLDAINSTPPNVTTSIHALSRSHAHKPATIIPLVLRLDQPRHPTRRPFVPSLNSQSENPSLKRCSESGDMRSSALGCVYSEGIEVDKETNNAVIGSQFLNACRKGNQAEAFHILSNKIKSYDILRMVDANKVTAQSHAEARGMTDLVREINNKKFELLLEACKKGDLGSIRPIYRELGMQIYKHERYSANDIGLIEAFVKDYSIN